MLITSYNQSAFGDTLIAITGPDTATQTTQQNGDVVAILNDQNQVIGYNFFKVSQWLGSLTGKGQVKLTKEQVAKLNAAIQEAGLPGQLEADDKPKFVIGKIVDFKDHPDADHLHVAQVDIGEKQVQIVCGAPNAALGQTIVVALPGAMMPDGKIIWPGSLRGVASYGMISSARELAIPGAPQRRGILVMPDELAAGTPFDAKEAAKVVAAQA
ncbi:DUF4479 and tRNA-binding domain-containing protein [Lacticaseibacillus casei]|jgi:tRNA-binding protein|uniref:DUF4479 and tRNA-binding domain-containing protein n=1 Tax=Lacticaseibacillus huelsenbergensis TaxID=3035291 RepID=A0ABY8DQC6_9LACO|nr:MULTISPECIES: DUF4479 and tRNA-binding domain-containing protein [Lacticaseibacillus]MDG3060543.1 DUF4479 and tRNA-binding domain-containing protein [Lacticaseibacillus sp. BCRC 81376]QVI37565.1 DUF4479 and tRNA-binding domain-containing protein [Lacticaseibacillus casei]QXG59352.1 DUF4479 and tRNA-binding domain-containing protein [Lacticaseibacillus casei]WFB39190.1 DUF4479 and tRNA-binding domain-containing protein [Lacticaseibacillus huelsenbergensis]WFB40892.1 DUF4479 and tRNA-binding 